MAIWITDPHTDADPYRDTGKTCLGRRMHCPSASSKMEVIVQDIDTDTLLFSYLCHLPYKPSVVSSQ